MRVLLAGATGAIGRPLVGRLLAAGHEVIGTTRSPARAEELRLLGAEPLVVDALDVDALRRAVGAARPDAVCAQLTALPAKPTPGAMKRSLHETDRLRRVSTPALIDAAREAGATRFAVQSIAFWQRPAGEAVLDEDAPMWTDGPAPFPQLIEGLLEMERHAVGAGGTVLRYGFFYGPGTWYSRDGHFAHEARRRRLPVIGSGSGMASFIHVDDAAAATAAALEHGPAAVLNVVDDDPAPMRDWAPAWCAAVGAPRPLRVPALLVRAIAGPYTAALGTKLSGASNARARQALGWEPGYASWREGFVAGI